MAQARNRTRRCTRSRDTQLLQDYNCREEEEKKRGVVWGAENKEGMIAALFFQLGRSHLWLVNIMSS
jgi:hypothetical protein